MFPPHYTLSTPSYPRNDNDHLTPLQDSSATENDLTPRYEQRDPLDRTEAPGLDLKFGDEKAEPVSLFYNSVQNTTSHIAIHTTRYTIPVFFSFFLIRPPYPCSVLLRPSSFQTPNQPCPLLAPGCSCLSIYVPLPMDLSVKRSILDY